MWRRLIPVTAGLALIVALVFSLAAGFGLIHSTQLAFAQPPSTATPQAAVQEPMHPLPPQLAFLDSMTADQRFDHTIGWQITFRNPENQDVVLNGIPGKIASVTANTVTITPNGSNQNRTFNVTSDTWIMGRPRPGSLSVFSQGDRVVVYAIGNSNDASAVVAARHEMHMRGYPMGRAGMTPTPTTATPAPTATTAPTATPTP